MPDMVSKSASLELARSACSCHVPRPPIQIPIGSMAMLVHVLSGTLTTIVGAVAGFEPSLGLTLQSLLQTDDHRIASLLSDRLANLGLDGQLVGAVTERHERALESMAVHRRTDLHETPGLEELSRAVHHHVCPSSSFGALL